MPVPFLLRVESDDPDAAERVAGALRGALAARGASHRIETARRDAPGVAVTPGVWDAEGRPRFLAPLPVERDPHAAAMKVLAFLESWGFVMRAARAPAS